ncbi:MAG: adenylyltransferase/cytidyltransferase family protein [Pseudomonadota bacterium]
MIFEVDHLAMTRLGWRDQGLSVGLCHGCFDIFHIGHALHLEECSKKVDRLIVSITADNFVRKGLGRPVFDEKERAVVIASIKHVDAVCISHSDTAIPVLDALMPTMFFKGKDYQSEIAQPGFVEEKEFANLHNISVCITKSEKYSSTNVLKLIGYC